MRIKYITLETSGLRKIVGGRRSQIWLGILMFDFCSCQKYYTYYKEERRRKNKEEGMKV
ncbi:MAG: hypothetical protein F6K23_20630 [Okeania sp. SIO2C9]|uniref:hypothetical protein n=1 Tax=Okeania sp. SIO2C9 TaxID=2607791 RepID=UPI0013C2562F|nr:hypothetical protein [Okeania sp. SIO2C9]NEQ75241.1 hypothetical protein [Okeania sp. SIO2C9]